VETPRVAQDSASSVSVYIAESRWFRAKARQNAAENNMLENIAKIAGMKIVLVILG
jgi:hypothetical protein